MINTIISAAIFEEFPFRNYNVIYTGIGKVNAAINLYSYLINYPDVKLIINVGTAGGVNCKKNQLIECGVFEDGQLNYPGSTDEIIVFDESKSKILTFDNFIFEKPEKYCECVDMESFALAKVCKTLGVNFKCYKYITDIVGEVGQDTEWLGNISKGKELLKNKIDEVLKKDS